MSEHLFATYPTLFETHCNSPLPPAIDAESSVPDYVLEICQQPRYTRVSLGKENGAYICTQRGPQQSATWKLYPRDYLVKRADETTADRKPIDPPPILQLQVSQRKDPWQNFLQSPYYFVTCALLKGDEAAEKSPMPNHLTGTVVSSLHRLKDLNNRDGAFFVFGDLGCKTEGKFRLRFTLYQMQKLECVQLVSTVSDAFQVYSPKLFPGLAQSTDLTRSFSDQGVRLRLRKALWGVPTRKRNTAAAGLFWEAPESHDQRRSKRKARTEDVFAHGVDGSAFDLQAHPTAAEYDCFSPPPQRMATKRRRLASDAFPPPSSYYSLESISTSTADLAYYNQPRAMEYYSMTTPVTSASYDYPDRAASLPMAQQLDRLVTEPHDGQHGGPGMSRRDDAFQKSLIAYPPQTAFPYSTLQAPPSSMGLNQYFDSPICSQNLAEDSSERPSSHE
ncbi:hypothetical protein SEPCBS119000_005129 [Sporothrix epigloea]|uniref:Velvet domain-containing protein n=1 Tax=Sporothrix epigloea TaxID=1892477 RepID=A0ABP0DZN7_9PEZI